jgi:hypothetical protein
MSELDQEKTSALSISRRLYMNFRFVIYDCHKDTKIILFLISEGVVRLGDSRNRKSKIINRKSI